MKKFLIIALLSINFYSFAVEDTALIIAAEGTKKDKETIAYFCNVVDLVEKSADVNETGAGNFTALMRASLSGFLNVVEYLISKGANVNAQDRVNKETALIKVIMKNWGILKKEDPEAEKKATFIVKMLLEAGADPNLPNENGQTPLMWAAAYDLRNIISLLLEYGANDQIIAEKGESVTSLSTKEALEFIELKKKELFGNDYLESVQFGYIQKVKYLLDAGADVNLKPKKGIYKYDDAPIMLATRQGHVELVDLLIDRDANVNTRDAAGNQSLLLNAVKSAVTDPGKMNNYYNIAKKLLEKGANPNIQSYDDKLTPLMIAAAGNLYNFMELLLDNKAMEDIKNSLGQTAMDLADEKGENILNTY